MGLFDDLIPQSEPRAMSVEGFQSNPRGFTTQDVAAAMRGDMFNAPGLPIKYEAQPGQTFGQSATANAQPFQNVVAHHTGGPTLEGALNTARRGDPFRSDVKYGYHFYIDTDGTVVQGAPLDARTNHVQPPGASQRTARPDISNNNSVGVSFVGTGSNPTPEQLAAAQNLTRALQAQYGIAPENVVGHGEIQSNRQTSEGMPLVNAIRSGTQVAQQQPAAAPPMSGPGVANAALPQPQAAPAKAAGMFADLIPSKGKDIGRGAAAMEGVRSGFTANFGDELAGAAAAAPTPAGLKNPFDWPSEAVRGLAQLGYEYLTGGDDAAKRYAARRDEVRANQKAAEEQYPGTYIAGQVGGALAVPVGGALNAATLPARMARGAAVGATMGGVAGAGEGTTFEDRASRGAIGVATGGALGAAGVPVIEGLARGAGFVASQPARMVQAALNPQGAAERAVGRAYREAIETDPLARQRLSQNELAASQAAGGPATVMDVLGGEGRNLSRSAGNLSGGARDTLNRTLDERFETQGQRFVNWLNDRFSYPNADAQQQAINHVERTVNRANYNRANQAGDRPLWSPELEQLAGSPAVQDAVRAAVTTGKDRAVTQGYGGFNSPVTVTPDGRLLLRRGPNGQPTYPNLQFWDSARRELSGKADAARRAGNNEDATRLGDLARQMNAALDNLVPEYQVARQGAARFFGSENALEAGQNFVTQNFNNAQTRRVLANMSDTERRLFQDGFVSRYIDMLNNVPDRADVVRRIYNSPANREKIQIALGRERATELEAMIRVETIMQQGLRAVQGNSTTAMQIAGLGLAGASGGGILGFDPTTSGLATALATAGKRGIDARVAQRVAELLTSNDPAVLNRGVQMLARNNRLMEALRSVDAAGVKAGGSQVPGTISGPSVPAIGRAEDQPEIPRPPRQ